MQYDAAITASALSNTLHSNAALSSVTVDAISTLLNLNNSTATVPVATSSGTNLSVNFDANGQIVTPKVTFFSDLGAAGTDVTVHIPTIVANSAAIIFNTSANVTAVIGNSSGAVSTTAAVVGDHAGRVIVLGSGNDNITITDSVNTYIDAGSGNATITTAGGNDTIVLNGGINTVSTGAGNDVIYAGNGINTINGGTGFDVVNVNNLADYTVSVSNGSVVLNSSTSGQETLTNVQFVASVNGTETLAIVGNQTEGTALRLYEALLGRDADASGTQYYTGILQAGAASLTGIANVFLGSAEYTAAHGSQSDANFINSLYQSALGRAATTDLQGLVYWAQQLATGHTRADVVLGIVGSTEAQAHDTGVIVVTGQV